MNKQILRAAGQTCLMLWITVIAGTTTVIGQRASPKLPRWSAEQKARKLSIRQSHELHLTKLQQQKILVINRDYALGIDELRAGSAPDSRGRMEKLKALHEQRDEKYRQVLDAGQFKHWNDLEMAQREKLKSYKAKRRKKILNEEKSASDSLPGGKGIPK
ncbi:MAG TPA: hypothetical protein VNE41_12540 [Chitinophagaceae bacterium]|nr:hypothetical protein [Chitinophagaceae bacterium]